MSAFNPARAYMRDLIQKPLALWRPPAHGIYVNSIGLPEGQQVLSVILDRQGQFQTEMFLAAHGTTEAFKHTHLGVDSVEVLVSGDFIFNLDGKELENKSSGQRIGDNFSAFVPDDMPHSARIKDGACFLSFQYWKDAPPSTIGNKFEVIKGE